MAFRVRVGARASRELDQILAWLLAQRAGEPGLRWLRGMHRAVASLSEMPYRCQVVSHDNRTSSREVRQLLYGGRPHTYCILFTIESDVVTILTIRHGRRLREPAS